MNEGIPFPSPLAVPRNSLRSPSLRPRFAANFIKNFYNQLTLLRPPNAVQGCVPGAIGRWPVFPNPPTLGHQFSQSDLDLVLYGHMGNSCPSTNGRHALSGLRINELSMGMDKIFHRQNMGLPGRFTLTGGKIMALDPAPLDLPADVCIRPTTFGSFVHFGVFSQQEIKMGKTFGPFKGKIVNTSEIKSFDDNSYMWEIFKEGRLSHFVDGRGNAGNWMSFVNNARHVTEQNLVVVQREDQLFYEACKEIPVGTELLIWYGDAYLQFLGIPVTLRESGTTHAETKKDHESEDGYQCARCGKVFAYEYYRDKHLKYTKCVDQGDRKFPCHLCKRSFEKRDRLRIHILHVHEKHRPHKCCVCGKSFSQSSSLNKHMRVHSGERPYKCVYCSKAFTASSILRTHIRQHSGEKPFKCKFCGKAFASHAAHDSHVRRTHVRDKAFSCKRCNLDFTTMADWKLHQRKHTGEIPLETDFSSTQMGSSDFTSGLGESMFRPEDMIPPY